MDRPEPAQGVHRLAGAGPRRAARGAALKVSLPWVAAHVEETEQLMGPDPWAYGLDERNAHVLSTFLRYSSDQGLARTPREPRDLFVPESLERFAV